MTDYIADYAEVIKRGRGSELRRERLLKKLGRFRRELRRVGGRIPDQRSFVAALCSDGHGDFEDLMHQLCVGRLIRGDFSSWEGWQFRNRWAKESYLPQLKERRWKGEKTSVAVIAEQGVGDEIMFLSCLPDVLNITPDVTVECDPRLVNIVARSFPVEVRSRSDLLDGDSLKYLGTKRPEEKFIPMGDLPRLFRRSLGDFPRKSYLVPDPEKVKLWERYRGFTGIAWRSRTGQLEPGLLADKCYDRSTLRRSPVLVLQYDSWEYETEGMEVPPVDLKEDLEDVFGICANLEKVVSVGQTIVHIAGSIGTQVDVVLPPVGSSRVENQLPWRYLDPMPWYPSVRVYQSMHAYE